MINMQMENPMNLKKLHLRELFNLTVLSWDYWGMTVLSLLHNTIITVLTTPCMCSWYNKVKGWYSSLTHGAIV